MKVNHPKAPLTALLPPSCLLCGAPGLPDRDVCAGCAADLPRLSTPCEQCALPLPALSDDGRCGRCRRNPPPWQRCLSATAYVSPVDRLVHRFKDHGDTAAGLVLTRTLTERLADGYIGDATPQSLIAVPLHPRRLWWRGYNPAMLVARWLGRALGTPVRPRALQRRRATPRQQGLSATARRRNLKRAFVLREPLPAHVALVDDVVTTGSTAHAVTRLLRRHGVRRVDVWCLARTPETGDLR